MPYKKSVISASQIVAAATRVLARKGYGRTSLNEIAKEAGMSKGAVHYHFPTKEALVGTVLETVCDAVAERTRAAWAQAEANPFAALRAAILELWDVRTNPTDEVKVIADLLAQSLHDDGLRPPLAAYYRFASMQTVEHLRGMARIYGLRPRVPDEMVPRLLLGLLDGLVLQDLVEPGAVDPEALATAVELMAGSLFELRGLEARP